VTEHEEASPQRRKGAETTSAALLRAAAELFAERGFDGTTVRDIAAAAGVNQALVFRYFGSKERLFATLLTRGGPRTPEQASADLVRVVLNQLCDDTSRRSLEQVLLAAIRPGTNHEVVALIRSELGAGYGDALAGLTDAPDAELRADLVLAWLLGIGLSRSVLGREALAGADADSVARYVLPGVRMLLERSAE